MLIEADNGNTITIVVGGYPIQKRGVTEYEGLYFLGMPWLNNRKSGILFGVGDDAAYFAEHIAARQTEHARVGV